MANKEQIKQRLKEFGLNHAEAFCLMLYRDKQGNEEWLWNSRDGVTPFCVMSRDGQEMQHVEWYRDQFLPNHQPKVGDRIFVDVTRELAEPKLRAYIDRFWEEGQYPMKSAYGSKQAAFERLLPGRTEAGQPFVLELTAENIGQYVKPIVKQERAENPNGSGILEVGYNDKGEVIINLPCDMTGHIVFSPSQALHLAGCLQRQARLAIEATSDKSLCPPLASSMCSMCQGAKHLQNSVTKEVRTCPQCNPNGVVDKSLIPGKRWA